MINIIYFLGILVLVGIVIFLVGLLVVGVLLFLALRYSKVYFPNLLVLLLSALESPMKAVFRFLNLDETRIESLIIEIQNSLYKPAFAKTAYKDRALFLPHCLRSIKCPAKLSFDGVQCIECGLCSIGDIKKKAEKLGYRVYITPGGMFTKRLLKEKKVKAVMGVACNFELREGLENCQKFGVPGQGINLLKDGCINTVADVDKINETLELKM